MYIEHIAMYVNDLEKTRDFFIKYFGQVILILTMFIIGFTNITYHLIYCVFVYINPWIILKASSNPWLYSMQPKAVRVSSFSR